MPLVRRTPSGEQAPAPLPVMAVDEKERRRRVMGPTTVATRSERNLSEMWSDGRSASRRDAQAWSRSWNVSGERSVANQPRMRASVSRGNELDERCLPSPERLPGTGQRVTTSRRASFSEGLSAREAGVRTRSGSREGQRDRTKRSFEYRLWMKALGARGASHSPSPGSPARFSTSSTFVSGESTPTASPTLREKPAAKIEPEKDRFLWRYPRDSGPAQDAGRSPPQDVAGLPQACAGRPKGGRACTKRRSDVSDEVAAAAASGPCIQEACNDKVEELRKSAAPQGAAASGNSGPAELPSGPSPIAPALAAVRWLLACCSIPCVAPWMHLAYNLLVCLLAPAARTDSDSDEVLAESERPAMLAESERRLMDAQRHLDECLLRLRRAQRRVDARKDEVAMLQRGEERGQANAMRTRRRDNGERRYNGDPSLYVSTI
jgi:hypothetical protein